MTAIQSTNISSRLPGITRTHNRLDIASYVKVTHDLNAERIACRDKVFKDDVNDVLVEDFYTSERIYVQLQALEFHTALVWNVLDTDRREVWKVREGTDRGELGYFKIDLDLSAGKLIWKGVQRKQVHLGPWRRTDVETLLVGWRRNFFGCHTSPSC